MSSVTGCRQYEPQFIMKTKEKSNPLFTKTCHNTFKYYTNHGGVVLIVYRWPSPNDSTTRAITNRLD